MEIKRLMNSTYYKLIVSQDELDELARGLSWLLSEGVENKITSSLLYDNLELFTTK